MCGRFVSSSSPEELAAYFGVDHTETVLEPNYNVAPTQDVYAVLEHGEARHLDAFFWGLVPSWARDEKIGARMINARAETVAEKNVFAPSLAKRRCLIPADGFYEWRKLSSDQKYPGEKSPGKKKPGKKKPGKKKPGKKKPGKKKPKQPMFVARRDGAPLALAGLWSLWRGPDRDQDPLRSVTIITTTPNDTMAPIHNRMPVILAPSAWDVWLDRDHHDVGALAELLVPAPDDLLAASPVSTRVNYVGNNGPELITAIEVNQDPAR